MSNILAKLKAAHDSRTMTEVKVPEYDDTWHFPVLTLADHAQIQKGVNLKSSSAERDLMVNGLIHMAHREEGSLVFDVPLEDKPALMAEMHKMELDVLRRIIQESSGGLSGAALADFVSADIAALRAALAGFAGDDLPALKAAAEQVDGAILQRALAVILEAHEAGQTVKNV